MGESADPSYVRAAGRFGPSRLYDPAIALTVRERRFRGIVIERTVAHASEDGVVVDVGSGTGTLAIALSGSLPHATVIAVDGDPRAMAAARSKAGAESVDWRAGMAGELPVDSETADVVVMSLLLHHIDRPTKTRALAEARRVLVPGGSLQIADWGKPHDPIMRTAFLLLQLLDGFDGTRDHAAGKLPALVEEAGFEGQTTLERLRTVWGSLELIEARKPGGPAALSPA